MSTCAPCNGTQTSSVSVSQHGNRYKISRLYSLRLLREHLVNSSSKRRIVLAIDTRGRACVRMCWKIESRCSYRWWVPHASRHVRRPEKYFDVLPCQTGRRVIEVDFREAGNRSRVKLKHKKIEWCIAPNGSIAIRTEMNLPFIMRTQMNKCFGEFKRTRDFSILYS